MWKLAPPGMDEPFALAGLLELEEREPDRTLVVDAAPTGHLVRLLELPGLALEWVHGLMRILLKYREATGLDAPGEPLLRLARRLRGLRAGLADPRRAAAVVVTLPEPLVAAESRRLQARLEAAGVPIAAVLYNRWTGRAAPAADAPRGARVFAPETDPPPAGTAALLDFFRHWESLQ